MLIAQKLRRQNIAAYIIYMYQVEDVIRAYGLDEERLTAEYLPRFNYEGEQLTLAREWHAGLIRMMHEEGREAAGHVQVVRATLQLMQERHLELLADEKQRLYNALYYKALPFIVELRSQGTNKDKSEVENCIDAMYGASLLRMQGRELSDGTRQALQPISQLMETLSQLYEEEE